MFQSRALQMGSRYKQLMFGEGGFMIMAAQWQIIASTVRGASHIRTGLPNQDALRSPQPSERGAPIVLAIADGHGSVKSFRSAVGAQYAVDVAAEVLRGLALSAAEVLSVVADSAKIEEQIARPIVAKWRDAVGQDLAARPFTEEELLGASQHEPGNREVVSANPVIAYGTTVLAALITEAFILYVQLGDGDIVTVSREGVVTRPLPTDARLFANETTSLSSSKAWQDFRVGGVPLTNEPPELILLATDGYANSFRTDADFLKVGADYLDLLRTEGVHNVADTLPDWLEEASRLGSGDDVTVDMLYRPTVMDEPLQGPNLEPPALAPTAPATLDRPLVVEPINTITARTQLVRSAVVSIVLALIAMLLLRFLRKKRPGA